MDHMCHSLAKLYKTNPYEIDKNYTYRQIHGWLEVEGEIQKYISDSIKAESSP